jgi:hypothetical protein
MKNLLFIALLFLVSCQKEEYEHNNAGLPSYVEFHIQTGLRTQVVIEDWGTGFEIFPPNEVIVMDGWRQSDKKNILNHRFTAIAFDDKGNQKYLGWGYVTQLTIIKIDNLYKTKYK